MRLRNAIPALCLLAFGALSAAQRTPPVVDQPPNAPGANPNIRRIVVSAGMVQGDTYTNKSIGVSCRFPAGWRASSAPVPPVLSERPALLLAAEPPEGPNASGIALWIAPLDKLDAPTRDPRAFLTYLIRDRNERQKDVHFQVMGDVALVDVDQRPFIKATVQNQSATPYFLDTFVGGVNGFMVVLEVTGRTQQDADELADSFGALSFFPPDDPDDSATDTIVIQPKPNAVKRITITEAAARARVRTKVEPQYPAEARDRGVEGEVLLDVVVGADGNVAEATVLSGHPLLNDAAVEAVKQWKFQPITSNGAPAEAETKVRVRFSLNSARQSS
jgi:TonB family protein